MELVERVLKGDKRAAARLITLIEDGDRSAVMALKALHPHTGTAHVVGITGPPGAGKSTLVDRLAKSYRKLNKKVGIIAVDPSSPFTGGAILGDRIRMSDLNTDPGVFIRSMSTRGHLGGLARTTNDAVRVLDALGMDVILVETVGAGQSEVDIASHAHTTLLVEMPGLGDDIQTIKAGIMEIGDIIIVNKADRPGADRTIIELKAMLELNSEYTGWDVPVISATASANEGISEIREAIEAHRSHLLSDGRLSVLENQRARVEILCMLNDIVVNDIMGSADLKRRFEDAIWRVASREMDPYTAAAELLGQAAKHR